MMSEFRFVSLPMAVALSFLATPLSAQTPPSTFAEPPPQLKLKPPTPPPRSALSPTTRSALKLAGLVTFVANACPTLKPNYARFEAAINALGVTKTDLDRPDMKGGYLTYTERYNADPKASCQRADEQFGPHGTTLPDIFEQR